MALGRQRTRNITCSIRCYGPGLRDAGYSGGNVILQPICQDSTGKVFKGKKWEFDISTDWWEKI
jgi:hypothetical protein